MPLNPLLDSLTDNPFTRLNALLAPIAPKANASPIALSVGEPQHEPPALLAETVAAHAQSWNKYPPYGGTPEVREASAAWLTRRYGLTPGALTAEKHVLTLAGSKEAIFLVALLAVPQQKGGEKPVVFVPNPYYLAYNGAAVMAGAEPVFLDSTRENGFLPDLDAIPKALLDRAALFYLCSPANPQGTIADLAYLKKAVALARAHDFVLCVDECYAEIYDRAPPPGALEACAALGSGFDNVLVLHSLSKRSSAAGLRSGFVAGDPALIAQFSHLRSYGAAQVPLPIQAAAAALWREEIHVEANRALYRRKFDLAEHMIGDRFGFYRPGGGFFLWLEVGDSEKAALALWRDAAIRVLPGGYIARPGMTGRNPGEAFIRLALVHDEATLETAFDRMRRVL